ncbi:MAG TPA: thiamine pyrophosphate-binding protein [Candidatus Thermoplasmatota archaeon]|nr:thiamine pyrophosphate-binding protein [Candidatus Thermoplasmatota archaeon]
MAAYHGGRLVARALKREGVDTIFTLCGGHIMNIYDGCLDEGIRVVDVRHEQAAVMAADGMARVTRDPGFAAVTAGPGVMNGVTGIANARAADSPVVVLGGQSDFARFGQGALQEGPQVPVVAPLTKWSASCYDARLLPDHIHAAFREAASPRTGPTFLEVPWDILFAEADEMERPPHKLTRVGAAARASERDLDAAARLLAEAERPVVVAGAGVWWAQGEAQLRAFADAFEAPFYLNSLARGTLPRSHPRFLVHSRGKALADADLILDLGTPFDFRMNFGEGLRADAKVIHAEPIASMVGRFPVDVALVGDIHLTLAELHARLHGRPQRDRGAWLAKLRAHDDKKGAENAEAMRASDTPMHALRFLKELNDAIDEDTIVVGDGGNIVALAGKILEVSQPGHWLDPGPYGTLGVGLPFGMAAKLARPAKKVLVLSGDGAFGLNGMEIESCARQDIPVVCVVANDGAWNQIRDPQVMLYGDERGVGTALNPNARYDLVATALGAHGEHVTEPKELVPAIERAFATRKASVLNVPIDRATNKGSGKPM